jgi:Zn-dependent metalloprotease
MKRTIEGILPPYLVLELIRRNPNQLHHGQNIAITQALYAKGKKVNKSLPLASGKAQRFVYDAKNSQRTPGTKARFEGDAPVSDKVVNNTYDFSGAVRDFYRQVCKVDSIDNKGMDMISTVHYGRGYNNAFWNGSQMTYGDGDGDIFATFVLVDVDFHECRHGRTEHTSGLEYYGQSGALNEHLSDVDGVVGRQWMLKLSVDQDSWLIGPGIFTSKVKGRALRDMLNPGTAYNDPRLGKDPQPAHMKDFVNTSSDNGGVHYNSGIPNKAFALFAKAVGGNSWENSYQVWLETGNRIKSDCDFQTFADTTVAVCGEVLPNAVQKLKDAWKAVGITVA